MTEPGSFLQIDQQEVVKLQSNSVKEGTKDQLKGDLSVVEIKVRKSNCRSSNAEMNSTCLPKTRQIKTRNFARSIFCLIYARTLNINSCPVLII